MVLTMLELETQQTKRPVQLHIYIIREHLGIELIPWQCEIPPPNPFVKVMVGSISSYLSGDYEETKTSIFL